MMNSFSFVWMLVLFHYQLLSLLLFLIKSQYKIAFVIFIAVVFTGIALYRWPN